MESATINATIHSQWLKKLPSPIYKLGAQSWIDYDYPRHLFIETTAACNLSCSYCPRERIGSHMDFQLFQAIVDEASSYGSRSFSLHLFGEPFLYPRLFDAVGYIKQKRGWGGRVLHTVLLTTNGTRLSGHVDELVQSGVDQVLWSWRPEATFTQETKEKLRRWGKFRVRFIEEVTPPEAYEEWKEWPNVEGRKLHNYGGNISISSLMELGVSTVGERDIGRLPSNLLKKRWPCYHLWLAPAVAWNGNILLCCADPHQKEILGTFPKQTVAEVWQGDRIKEVREGHMKGEYKGICTNCDVWKQYPDLFFQWQKKQSVKTV